MLPEVYTQWGVVQLENTSESLCVPFQLLTILTNYKFRINIYDSFTFSAFVDLCSECKHAVPLSSKLP